MQQTSSKRVPLTWVVSRRKELQWKGSPLLSTAFQPLVPEICLQDQISPQACSQDLCLMKVFALSAYAIWSSPDLAIPYHLTFQHGFFLPSLPFLWSISQLGEVVRVFWQLPFPTSFYEKLQDLLILKSFPIFNS